MAGHYTFSFDQFDFAEIQDTYSSFTGVQDRGGGDKGKQSRSCGLGDCWELIDTDFPWSDVGGCQDKVLTQISLSLKYHDEEQQQNLSPGFETPDDFSFDSFSSPLHGCNEEIMRLREILNPPGITDLPESDQEKSRMFPLASLALLNNAKGGLQHLNGKKLNPLDDNAVHVDQGGKVLSTMQLIKLAGANFMQFSSRRVDNNTTCSHPFPAFEYGLSEDVAKDVALVQLLLTSAEKIGYQQYDGARRLLEHCDVLSSGVGTPVQRLVYYFSEALREKVVRETGPIRPKRMRGIEKHSFHLQEAIGITNSTTVAFHLQVPFFQVGQFTGVQLIMEQLASAKKIHIIDLLIRSGVQWIIMMQSLVSQHERSLEHLKITAIATKSKGKIEETGKRLVSFAESIHLPFSFEVVEVPNVRSIDEDLVKVEVDEVLAVYSPLYLSTLIAYPESLDCVMTMIKSLKPCIMVVIEVEANQNSPVFANRFVETLLHHSAFFDCFDACMERNDRTRMALEKMYLSEGIRNIVAAEGKKRKIRHVKIGVWRKYFGKFGMVETELSMSSMCQADMMLKNFPCGKFCTFGMDKKSLTVGWKGRSIFSVSTWKFL